MYTLAQLECFIAVAEELHFGSAADRLNMTQPPLSRQIQQLERELGARLFDRTSRRVSLTTAGRALLPRARQVIDLAAKASADIRLIGDGAAGTLTIGYTALAGISVLPHLIELINKHLPGVTVLLRESVSHEQLEELARGAVDFALLRPVAEIPGVNMRPVQSEQMLVALPSNWPQAQSGVPLRLEDLSHAPFLMFSPAGSAYLHDLLRAMFLAAGVQPRIVQYAEQAMALLALVGVGLGCALVPASASAFAPPHVTLLPLHAEDPAAELNRAELNLAWEASNPSPVLHVLLEILEEALS